MSWAQKALTTIVQWLGFRPEGAHAGGVSAAGVPVNTDSVLSLSTAWACVNLLAGTQASLPVLVTVQGPSGRVVDRDHRLYRLLHDSPNADQTAMDFWEFICASLELHGNAFARIERMGRVITALTPFGPVGVSVTRNRQTLDLEYRWSEDGKAQFATQDDVLHIRGFGGSPLGGLSTLAYGRQVFGLASALDRSAATTFANGLRPAGVFTFPTVLKPEQRADIEKGLQNKYMGAMNAGRPLVLEAGVTWEQITLSPEDAQMLQSRAFSVEDVCRFFGVPPFMIGHTEKVTSWGTGLEQQILGFQKFTLRRRLKRIEQAITKQLLTAEDRARGVSVEFNLEALLRGDSTARGAFYTSGLNAGWMTINEVRDLESLPPVAGGDVPRMQAQNIPITLTAPPKLLAAPSE